MQYANAAERLLAAIGEPQMIDTAKDPRLGRIFSNRTIRSYPAFAGFYGMEDTIERIVGFFRHAAQGLEERKQILYLLGPVGGGKSSLAERLKQLMEVHPIYVLKAGDELSPVFESPLGLGKSRASHCDRAPTVCFVAPLLFGTTLAGPMPVTGLKGQQMPTRRHAGLSRGGARHCGEGASPRGWKVTSTCRGFLGLSKDVRRGFKPSASSSTSTLIATTAESRT